MHFKEKTTVASSRKGDMTQGNIYSALILFAIPSLFTTLLTQLYNMIDSVIVGQNVGADALAAVGANAVLTMMFTALFQGAAVGGSVYISQLYGAKQDALLSKAFNTLYMLSALIAAAAGVIGLVFGTQFMEIMNTPENIFNDSLVYFRITCASLPGLAIYMAGSTALRSVGDTKAPLYFLIATSVLHIALNLLFVVVLDAGVSGVAWSTLISQYLSALLVLWRTGRTSYCNVEISLKAARIDLSMAKIILKLGIPSAIQTAVTSIGSMLVQRYTNMFGSAAIAATTVVNRLDSFIALPAYSLSMSLSVFYGQNLAAKKHDRLHKAAIFSCIVTLSLVTLMTTFGYVYAEPAAAIFTSDSEVIRLSGEMFRVLSFFFWSMALYTLFTSIIRGAGDAVATMVISSFCVAIRVPLTWLLAIRPEPNVFANLFLAMGISYLLNAVLIIGYYLTGRWKRKVIITIDE